LEEASYWMREAERLWAESVELQELSRRASGRWRELVREESFADCK